MKQKARTPHVILRGTEAGNITKADIERRAEELSLLRTGHNRYTDVDLAAAERELYGGTAPASTAEDADPEVFLSRDLSQPRGDRGHQQTEVAPDQDEENEEPERLVIQGVEEAQHDQMVRARREGSERDARGD